MGRAGASVHRIAEKLSSYSFCTLFHVLLLLLCLELAVSHSTVRYLPGFPGALPFELETGYVGVDESEDVQLFYYFVRSGTNPKEDPVIIWLTGGPGCSSFSGLVYEIGPIKFETRDYSGSLPTLVLNPNSWTKVASIIFLDSPVGTGFSYSRTLEGSKSGDTKACDQIYQFLRKWLIDHPEFLSNPFYVAGDSYSGRTVPLVVQDISDGNGAGNEPFINLKGYLLGNPATDSNPEADTQVPFAYGMGLVSDEIYESIKRSCAGDYINVNGNVQCTQDLEAYHKCTTGINFAHILEPLCPSTPPKPKETAEYKRSLSENFRTILDLKPILSINPQASYTASECRSYGYLLSNYWINDMTVRKALHIQEGTVKDWQRCSNGIHYNFDIESSFKYHVNLSKRGYRSLVYSGDHDMIVPYLATQAWIRSLNYSIIDDWRQWSVDGQVGGYTRTYSNNMTFATVKGGGHTAPEYQPKECFAMFKRWISNKPL